MNLAEEARVHSLGDTRAAFHAVLTDQHRRVRRQDVNLHIVEVKLATALRRAAIVPNIVFQRSLPAFLEFAAGDEDHVGFLKAGHVAAKVAVVPGIFHPVDRAKYRRPVSLRRRSDEREEDDQAQRWNSGTTRIRL